jgi:hypothetical protein
MGNKDPGKQTLITGLTNEGGSDLEVQKLWHLQSSSLLPWYFQFRFLASAESYTVKTSLDKFLGNCLVV